MKRFLSIIILILVVCNIAAQKPVMVVPIGHTESIDHIGFNTQWKHYFSTSGDGSIKGWEKETGKLLYSANKGNSFKLSPDSRAFASISEDKKTVLVKSTQNGEVLYQLHENQYNFKAFSFSPDDIFLVTISVSDPFIKEADTNKYSIDSVFISVWNRGSGKLLYKIFSGMSWLESDLPAEMLEFSSDAKWMATATAIQKTVKVWEVESGKQIYTLSGDSYAIANLIFSPDNKTILVNTMSDECFIWDIKKEKQVGTFKYISHGVSPILEFSKDGDYILLQYNSGAHDTAFVRSSKTVELLYSFSKDDNGSVTKTLFSPNGKLVFYNIKNGPAEYVLNALELKTGKIIYTIKHTYLNKVTGEEVIPYLSEILFSPDGNSIITKSFTGTIKVWNIKTGDFLRSLGSGYDRSNNIQLSNDGNYIIEKNKKRANIWDYQNGKLINQISCEGHSFSFKASDISPDGRFIVVSLNDNKIRIVEIKTGKVITCLTGHTGVINAVKYSPDGKLIVSASHDNSAKVWDAEGHLIETLEHPYPVLDAQFSPDSKHIVTACGDYIARIWNIDNAMEEYLLKGHTGVIFSANYSQDGKYIITGSADNTAKGWESETGKLVYTLDHKEGITKAYYSRDGKVIVTKGAFGGLYFWDSDFSKNKMELMKSMGPFTGKVTFQYSADGRSEIYWFQDTVRILDIKKDELTKHYLPEGRDGMTFSTNGDFLITYSNSELKIFEVENYSLKYKLIIIDNADYLNIDPEGRFDGTEAARKMIYYACGNDIIDLDQIKDLCWEPGLVEKIMGTNNEPIKAKKLDEISICGTTPIIENLEETKDLKKFKIIRRKGGVGEVALYINQKEVEKIPVRSLVFTNDEAIVTIDLNKYKNYLEAGKSNSIQLQARTVDLTINTKGSEVLVQSEEKITTAPNLYAIIAGVSDYKGNELDLKFASKDASDFSSALQLSSRKLLNIDGKEHVFVTTLVSGTTTPPTKENIRNAFEDLKTKAKANDIIVIYVSGHGEKYGTETTNFYYLTADAASFNLAGVEKEVAISTNEFADWLKVILARKQILILDACASGKLAEDMAIAMRAGVPSDQIKALDRLNSRTGTFILSGAAANQSAYETSMYGQGLLTYSLLYGMKSGEALKENTYVDVDKLFQYCADKVKELAIGIGGIQDPVISKPLGGASFDIGKIDTSVSSKIILALPKMIFTNSKFSNRETDDDNLGLEKAIDDVLNVYSSKGKDSKLVFTERSQLADSYKLVGSYQIVKNKITIIVRVKKGNNEIQKFEIKDFENDKEKLAKEILERVSLGLK